MLDVAQVEIVELGVIESCPDVELIVWEVNLDIGVAFAEEVVMMEHPV